MNRAMKQFWLLHSALVGTEEGGGVFHLHLFLINYAQQTILNTPSPLCALRSNIGSWQNGDDDLFTEKKESTPKFAHQ